MMDGSAAYSARFEGSMNKALEKNQDLPYMSGFTDFLLVDHSESTVYGYVLNVIRFMRHIGKEPSKLGVDDYSSYMRTKKGATQAYQIMVYSSLKKFSEYLVAAGVNDKDSMRFISRPKFFETAATREKREISALNRAEISVYLENVERGIGSKRAKRYQLAWKDRDVFLIHLLLNTGIRCSGAYKLNVQDIDIEGKTVTVTDKGHKTYVCVMSDNLTKLAFQWLVMRSVFMKGIDDDALFISSRRTRMTQDAIRKVTKKYGVGVGKIAITPHKLRATFGTQVYEARKDIVFLKNAMHHSNTKTSEIYVRGYHDSSAKVASEIMDGITKGGCR